MRPLPLNLWRNISNIFSLALANKNVFHVARSRFSFRFDLVDNENMKRNGISSSIAFKLEFLFDVILYIRGSYLSGDRENDLKNEIVRLICCCVKCMFF